MRRSGRLHAAFEVHDGPVNAGWAAVGSELSNAAGSAQGIFRGLYGMSCRSRMPQPPDLVLLQQLDVATPTPTN